MKTESVTVGMGATVPHPTLDYANLKADVRYTIRLEDSDTGEAWQDAEVKLKSRAKHFLEQAMTEMVADCLAREEARAERRTRVCDLQNFDRNNKTDIPF